MLFWLFIIIFLIGLIMYLLEAYAHVDFSDLAAGFAVVCFVLGSTVSFVNLAIVLPIKYINADAYVSAMTERYESLTYQYENDIYNNDNDVGKRELMEDIQNWNEDLAKNKELQNNFWVGIFVPDVYDQFEFIELDVKETEG